VWHENGVRARANPTVRADDALALSISQRSADSAHVSLRTPACVTTVSAVVLAVVAPQAVAGQESFTSDGSWVVPAGVSVVQVNITSGSGGDGGRNEAGDGPSLGGLALRATAQLSVTPGETIYIGLGENGQDATTGTAVAAGSAFGIGPGGKYTWNAGEGGGGGGASAVAIDDDIVLIAGAGGGAGGWSDLTAFPQPWSGAGGAAGSSTGGDGQVSQNSDGIIAAGGDGGSDANGTTASTLSRTGSGGGSGQDSDGCCNAHGGGGGAGYYGGLKGTSGGGDLDEAAGGGGGGGSSYASPSRIGADWYVTPASRGSTPSGSIQYIDVTTTALPDATAGTAFSTTLSASVGSGGSVNQWVVSPALPAGLSLDSTTGVLSGTATSASSATYTFTASWVSGGRVAAETSVDLPFSVVGAPTPTPSDDSDSGSDQSSSASRPVSVAPSLSLLPPGEFTWQRGVEAAVRVVANSGSSATFSVDPALPSGLHIDPTSGVIEGAPLAVHEESEFQITAVNAQGSSTVTIAVSVTSKDVSAPETVIPPSVRFAPRSAKLTNTMKGELDEWLVAQRKTQVTLTSVIPRSGKGAKLARKRAVQVRKYLRSRDARVQSVIHLALAQEPMMTRRVLSTS